MPPQIGISVDAGDDENGNDDATIVCAMFLGANVCHRHGSDGSIDEDDHVDDGEDDNGPCENDAGNNTK